jgi:methylaspartate mutase epsilon subunit
MLAASSTGQPHLETFGGCMLGQLCPPSLLVAISVLEAMFFAEHGISDISLSYAQQTSASQDAEAIAALRCLAGELIPDVDMHIVLYAYMGVYPRTADGALSLLGEAARLAVRTGSERLIVKTVAEAHRIPTIAENVQALGAAAGAADAAHASESAVPDHRALDSGIYAEARAIIETVLDLAAGQPGGLADALVAAFARGVLDVPFCLHPDNAGATRSYIDIDGRLRWAEIGALPIDQVGARGAPRSLTAADLLQSLTYVERTFDGPVLARSRAAAIGAKTRDDGWN